MPLLFKQGRTDLYFRTPMQFVYVGLLLVGLIWPIVGSVILLLRVYNVWYLIQLVATVILLLALGMPHPKLVCSHCRQGECGACPMGRMLRRI